MLFMSLDELSEHRGDWVYTSLCGRQRQIEKCKIFVNTSQFLFCVRMTKV